jgi:hypothetical protein
MGDEMPWKKGGSEVGPPSKEDRSAMARRSGKDSGHRGEEEGAGWGAGEGEGKGTEAKAAGADDVRRIANGYVGCHASDAAAVDFPADGAG